MRSVDKRGASTFSGSDGGCATLIHPIASRFSYFIFIPKNRK
jgi:hypothetical protein